MGFAFRLLLSRRHLWSAALPLLFGLLLLGVDFWESAEAWLLKQNGGVAIAEVTNRYEAKRDCEADRGTLERFCDDILPFVDLRFEIAGKVFKVTNRADREFAFLNTQDRFKIRFLPRDPNVHRIVAPGGQDPYRNRLRFFSRAGWACVFVGLVLFWWKRGFSLVRRIWFKPPERW